MSKAALARVPSSPLSRQKHHWNIENTPKLNGALNPIALAGQSHVQDGDIGGRVLGDGERIAHPCGDTHYLETGERQNIAKGKGNERLIFDNENFGRLSPRAPR